jgi:hypothetical protein
MFIPKPEGAPPLMPTLSVCRRMPPQLVPIRAMPEAVQEMNAGRVQAKPMGQIPLFPLQLQSTAQFPIVGIDDWCGEFQQRKGA